MITYTLLGAALFYLNAFIVLVASVFTHSFNKTAGAIILSICSGTFLIFLHVTAKKEQKQNEMQQANTMQELSTLQKAKDAAIFANKAKQQFLANMTYAVRTPMNSIFGATQLMLHDNPDEKISKKLQYIQNSCEALMSVFNNITDFSLIESQTLDIKKQPYELVTILRDVIADTRFQAAKKKLEFIADIDPDIPNELNGDAARLHQIFAILLGNAVKFTKTGSVTLKLTCQHTPDGIILDGIIKDTGVGIPKEQLDTVFESFAHFSPKQDRTISGIGLELFICRELLSLMNGMIQIDSTGDFGTTMHFTLPQEVLKTNPVISFDLKKSFQYRIAIWESSPAQLAICEALFAHFAISYVKINSFEELTDLLNKKEEITHIFLPYEQYDSYAESVLGQNSRVILISPATRLQKTYPGTIQLSYPLSGLNVIPALEGVSANRVGSNYMINFTIPSAKILIVDDHLVNLKVAKGLLSAYQPHITTAVSGYECLELLEKQDFDLIFMDYMMPGMDGIETFHKIRRIDRPGCQQVPVIALTANTMDGMEKTFLNEGFAGFIPKPMDITTLENILLEHLPKEKILENANVQAAKTILNYKN